MPPERELRERDIDALVVCGMMTSMCVDATVRAAADLGFTVTVIHDAVRGASALLRPRSASRALEASSSACSDCWKLDSVGRMRFVVVITEINIDEATRPQAFRFVLDAATEAAATVNARKKFKDQTGRQPAPRAIIDVASVD